MLRCRGDDLVCQFRALYTSGPYIHLKRWVQICENLLLHSWRNDSFHVVPKYWPVGLFSLLYSLTLSVEQPWYQPPPPPEISSAGLPSSRPCHQLRCGKGRWAVTLTANGVILGVKSKIFWSQIFKTSSPFGWQGCPPLKVNSPFPVFFWILLVVCVENSTYFDSRCVAFPQQAVVLCAETCQLCHLFPGES